MKNGCYVVAEGANMPTHARGRRACSSRRKILYGPGKAANAGGVATSGLEMSQNSMRLAWTREEVDYAPARHHEGHPQAVRRRRQGVRHARATTSSAPTSPASSRSPTPCSTRASSDPAWDSPPGPGECITLHHGRRQGKSSSWQVDAGLVGLTRDRHACCGSRCLRRRSSVCTGAEFVVDGGDTCR